MISKRYTQLCVIHRAPWSSFYKDRNTEKYIPYEICITNCLLHLMQYRIKCPPAVCNILKRAFKRWKTVSARSQRWCWNFVFQRCKYWWAVCRTWNQGEDVNEWSIKRKSNKAWSFILWMHGCKRKWWKLCISLMLFHIIQEHMFHHIKCN
jgi:hypothetical protein